MNPLLFAIAPNAYNNYCSFAGIGIGSLNSGGWLYIIGMVLSIIFAIAAVTFAISNIFPTAYREKMKGAAKYEAFQGIISAFMIAIIIATSSTFCYVGQLLVYQGTPTHYQNPLQYSETYVSTLMFTTGLGIFSSIYSESILLTLDGNIANLLEELLSDLTAQPALSLTFGVGLLGVFFGFAGALTNTYLALIAVAFGILFMIYITIPFIQQIAFTVVLPVAIIMRSIPFAGPNLRQTSDTFIALAIAFYIIFPLMILFNAFVITWIFTPCTGAALCNPYSQFNAPYGLSGIPISKLFTTPPQTMADSGLLGGAALPTTFLSSSYTGLGGFLSALSLLLENLYQLPYFIIRYSQKTAEYLFESVFLIGLDLAVTVAFAMGLSKGLGSVGRMLGVGPFWGNS